MQSNILVCSGNKKLFATNMTSTLTEVPEIIESHLYLLLFTIRLIPNAVENSARDFMNAERGTPLIATDIKSAKDAKKAELTPKSETATPIGNPLRSNFSVGCGGKTIFNLRTAKEWSVTNARADRREVPAKNLVLEVFKVMHHDEEEYAFISILKPTSQPGNFCFNFTTVVVTLFSAIKIIALGKGQI